MAGSLYLVSLPCFLCKLLDCWLEFGESQEVHVTELLLVVLLFALCEVIVALRDVGGRQAC